MDKVTLESTTDQDHPSELISIIIPVYRTEAYLEQCIESVVNQTYKSLEIILIDDSSPDRCPEICDRWAERDNRIRVIHQKNGGGVVQARNTGIDHCLGKFISFIDSDDTIAPDMIQYLYKLLLNYQVDISIVSAVQFSGELPEFTNDQYKITLGDNEAFLKKLIYESDHWQPWAKLYKSALFKNGIRFIDGSHEDIYFTLRVLSKATRLVISENQWYGYRQRDDSLSGIDRQNIPKNLLENLQQAISFSTRHYGKNSDTYKLLHRTFILHAYRRLLDLERYHSYRYNPQYIAAYKKIIRNNWASIKQNELFSFQSKVGLFISMYSALAFNKSFLLADKIFKFS